MEIILSKGDVIFLFQRGQIQSNNHIVVVLPLQHFEPLASQPDEIRGAHVFL